MDSDKRCSKERVPYKICVDQRSSRASRLKLATSHCWQTCMAFWLFSFEKLVSIGLTAGGYQSTQAICIKKLTVPFLPPWHLWPLTTTSWVIARRILQVSLVSLCNTGCSMISSSCPTPLETGGSRHKIAKVHLQFLWLRRMWSQLYLHRDLWCNRMTPLSLLLLFRHCTTFWESDRMQWWNV